MQSCDAEFWYFKPVLKSEKFRVLVGNWWMGVGGGVDVQ